MSLFPKLILKPIPAKAVLLVYILNHKLKLVAKNKLYYVKKKKDFATTFRSWNKKI